MYVYEEEIILEDGTKRNLTDIINDQHENVKYLPGIDLPENVKAIPDLATACRDATILVFVTPHQFLTNMLPIIREAVAPHCRGVTLIKGIDFDPDHRRPVLISTSIRAVMGRAFECGALMGANVANEVAQGQLCEATLACDFGHLVNERTRVLFDAPLFRVQHIHDVAGAQIGGALKNVVALGAGFVDALRLGGNTKSALLRIGLIEMAKFGRLFFSGVRNRTWVESCGVADLITTCYGGRNRLCAEMFAKERLAEDEGSVISAEECEKRWKRIEQESLNGQKLQGTLTAKDVYLALESRETFVEKFPLFEKVYQISFEGRPIKEILDGIQVTDEGHFY
jgi:glycerol-3-phosphate dehydrogenase (NAD+)